MGDFDIGDFETIELTVQDGHIAIEGHGRNQRYVRALADKVWIEGTHVEWRLGPALDDPAMADQEQTP